MQRISKISSNWMINRIRFAREKQFGGGEEVLCVGHRSVEAKCLLCNTEFNSRYDFLIAWRYIS